MRLAHWQGSEIEDRFNVPSVRGFSSFSFSSLPSRQLEGREPQFIIVKDDVRVRGSETVEPTDLKLCIRVKEARWVVHRRVSEVIRSRGRGLGNG